MKPKIIVTGILDTKGNELKYLAEQVAAAGGDPTILELSIGKEVGWADISMTDLLAIAGETQEQYDQLNREQRFEVISKAAIKKVSNMMAAGQVDGIVSYGGSMGASLASLIMQNMPIGTAKMMLTTMASGDARPYIGTKDICLMYPIAEAGLNTLTKRILTNAAYGIVGMASAPPLDAAEDKPLIGCMMFGVTTPTVLRASKHMEDQGYDVIINHAIGTGGMSMEQMIDDGYIKGLLDITTHEIADEMLGGVLSAGPDRMTAAGRKGIPQVIAPGGLDLINFGPKNTIPEHYMEQTKTVRGLYEHNPNVTCVSILPEEAYAIALEMATKLNAAKGPTAICVPMRGWGACDTRTGWANNTAGPTWVGDPDKPEWSLRSKRFVEGLQEKLDLSKPNVELLIVDCEMNDPEFADLMSGILVDMLNGRWEKGQHNSSKGVVS